jgi:hypothetical protein
MLEQRLNEAANQVSQYFQSNGLVLNLTKTHFIHFHLGGRVPRDLEVVVNGTKVGQVQSTTFLGFDLDGGLRWDSHISKVCKRLGGACFALRRLARVMPRDVVRSCYFATVHSLPQYGTELWGRAAEWERVFRMQKRAVRAIAQVGQRVSARPYFRSLGILTLPSIIIYQVATYVRCNLNNYATGANVHGRNLRNAHRLVGVNHRLKKSAKLTHVMGPTVYNRLPARITGAPSLVSFKYRLKLWLIEHAFYTYNEFIMMK